MVPRNTYLVTRVHHSHLLESVLRYRVEAAAPICQQESPRRAHPPPQSASEGRPLPPHPRKQQRLFFQETLLPGRFDGLFLLLRHSLLARDGRAESQRAAINGYKARVLATGTHRRAVP